MLSFRKVFSFLYNLLCTIKRGSEEIFTNRLNKVRKRFLRFGMIRDVFVLEFETPPKKKMDFLIHPYVNFPDPWLDDTKCIADRAKVAMAIQHRVVSAYVQVRKSTKDM